MPEASGDIELWHEFTGRGSPVVLLHAGICDCRQWNPQWESLAGDHHLLRIDLRGYGRSPMPPGPFSFARDVVRLLDRLALGPVTLVGCSMSGVVAQEIAVARPDLVDRLVLVCSGMPGIEPSADMRRLDEEDEAAFERGDLEAIVDANVRFWVDGPRRGPEAVAPEVRALVTEMWRHALELQAPVDDQVEFQRLVPDISERVGEISVPTLVIVGEEDAAGIVAAAEGLAATIPNARLERLPDVAHLPNLERPDLFDPVFAPFLSAQGS